MALKFNTFRSERYLRSRFIEGRYFLASEATDLELEMIDNSRQMIKKSLGNIAVEDSWKIEKYEITTEVTNVVGTTLTVDSTLLDIALIGDEVYKSGSRIDTISNIDSGAGTITLPSIGSIIIGDTITIRVRNTLLLRSGEAWHDGILFAMQGGEDAAVSGSNLAMGITVPIGGGSANVTAQDEPEGLGKLLTFNDGGTTPAGQYRIVVSAREEVITDQEDPFIKNANIPESTGQKMRMNYRINVVPESAQESSPVPYTDSTTDGNLENDIIITPILAGEGAETSRVTVTGSEQIDGRNLEVNFQNTVGSNKFPLGTTQQSEFSNGKIVDSKNNEYHINLITNATVANEVTVRIDKAPSQPDPEFIAGKPFIIRKRDVFVTDDVNGNPQGQLFYPVATVNLESGTGFNHKSNIVDRRGRIISKRDYEEVTNIKFGLKLADGGSISWEVVDTDILEWDAAFALINPHGPEQTIAANQVALLDAASVVYTMDLDTGGGLAKGNLAITVTSGTTTLTTSGNPDLSQVCVGNMLKLGSETRQVTAVDDIAKTVTVNSAVSSSGAATIYLDTFAQGTAPLNEDIFVLATRRGTNIHFSNLELASGETSTIGSAIPQAFLDYVGTPSENDSTPDYATAQETDITFDAPSEISDSEYFLINAANDSTRYYVWFDKSGSAVDPNPGAPITTGVEVDISGAATADDVATAVAAELDLLADFSASAVGATVTVTNAATGAATPAANVDVGGDVIIDYTFGSPAFITQGVSLTGALIEVDKSLSDFNSILDQPIYDEVLRFPAGLSALTDVTIPSNSRNLDAVQFYVPDAGALEVFINSRYTLQDEEWTSVDTRTVRFNDDLPPDTTVHFRLDSLGGSTATLVITGGGDAWGDPVDTNIIPDSDNTRDLGSALIKFRDGYFAGKLTVDGVIDPTGLELTPQASDPLAAGQAGIYIDTSDRLIQRKTDNSTTNLTQRLDDLEAGDGITHIARTYSNVSGVTIPQFAPVYASAAGQISLANGNAVTTAKVIGIALEEITTGNSGRIAISGYIPSFSGFSHGDRLYLDQTNGVLTTTEPTIGTYSQGFTIMHIGVMEGTNLMLQIYREGIL